MDINYKGIRFSHYLNEQNTLLGDSLLRHELQRDVSLSTALKLSKDFPVNLAYSRKRKNELEDLRFQEENLGISTKMSVFKWFQPNFDFNLARKEDYLIQTDNTGTLYKDISRTNSGNVDLNLRVATLIEGIPLVNRIKLFSSLVSDLTFNGRYGIQDGDIYKNVAKDFNYFVSTHSIPVPDLTLVRDLGDVWSGGFLLSGTTVQHKKLLNNSGATYLKSADLKDSALINGTWAPLSALKLGKSLSAVTGTRLRGKLSSEVSQSINENTASVRNRISKDLEITIPSLDQLPLVKLLPVSGAQCILQGTLTNDDTFIITSTNTVRSVDSRCKFWIFDLWFKYTNTMNRSDNYAVFSSSQVSDNYNANLNFRIAGDTQFIVKWSQNESYQYDNRSKMPMADDRNSNFGIDMNTSIPFAALGFPAKGSARIRSTLINWQARQSPVLKDKNKESDTISLMNTTVELNGNSNILVSFGGSYAMFRKPRNENGVRNSSDYNNLELWAKLTFQF